jgi:hypothetical protein
MHEVTYLDYFMNAKHGFHTGDLKAVLEKEEGERGQWMGNAGYREGRHKAWVSNSAPHHAILTVV